MPYCENCGKKLRDTAKFCPGCGAKVLGEIEAPVVQEIPAPALAVPEAPAPERPAPEVSVPENAAPAKKPFPTRVVVLCCLGGLLLVAVVALLLMYWAALPGKLSEKKVAQIQSSAEERMEGVLKTLGYDGVEVEVKITDKVINQSSDCDERFFCLRRRYFIDFELTTDGSLSDMDKAAIVLWMEDLYGFSPDYKGQYSRNFNSPKDMYESHHVHDKVWSSREDMIMGVPVPQQDFSWSTAHNYIIDGWTYYVVLENVWGDTNYTCAEVMDYIIQQRGVSRSE